MYKEPNNIYMCRASNSLSSTIGNTSMIVKEFKLSLFPEGLFKRVFIDTSMSTKEYIAEKDDVYNKQGFPYLVIKPRFTFGDDSIFGKMPDWICTNYFNFKHLDENYSPVFADYENGIYMYAVMDRIKITFEIEIVCATKMEQINMAQFLKMSVLHRGYFYLNNATPIHMEAQVPKLYIRCIDDILGYDLNDPEEHIAFTDYLESCSQEFITEKFNPATSDPSYYYMYDTKLLMLFEDYPQVDEGEQKDHSKTNFRVTDTLTVDYWVPSCFFFETIKQINPQDYKLGWDISDFGEQIKLVYTMQMLPEKWYKKYDKTYTFYKKQAYMTEESITDNKDIIDLRFMIKRELKEVAEYCKFHMLDINNVFDMRLYEEFREIDPNNIDMDWDNLILTHENPKPNTMYHLFLYINYVEFNRIRKRLEEKHGNIYIDEP